MIIEVIGFSSTGKTTLLEELLQLINTDGSNSAIFAEYIIYRARKRNNTPTMVDSLRIDILFTLALPFFVSPGDLGSQSCSPGTGAKGQCGRTIG